ncbi:MAG: tetratricopeptide repeat protein [Planctomycetota bacterium]
MSSQRRHELEENELAGFLGAANEIVEKHSKPLALGVTALVVAIVGWSLYSSGEAGKRSTATLQLVQASSAGDADSLAAIAAEYPDTSAGAFARLYHGSQQMAAGISALFTSPDEAEELLGDAESSFRQALQIGTDPTLASRAHLGLAQIAESRGEVEDAIASYEAAAQIGESEALIKQVEDRIALLRSQEGKSFLAWFQEQDFSPADPAMPPALPDAGGLPALPDLNLAIPDLTDLPETEGSDQASTEEAAGDMSLNAPEEDSTTDVTSGVVAVEEVMLESATTDSANEITPEEPATSETADATEVELEAAESESSELDVPDASEAVESATESP